MRRGITKIAAVMALTVVVAGSSSSVASAHHRRAHRVVVPDPAPVCYEDGSCDVDGVCLLGVECDGTVHHTDSCGYSVIGHHGGCHH